jgi:hypothetical protein
MILRKKVMSGALKDPKLAFEVLRRLDTSFVENIGEVKEKEQ